MFAGNFEGQAAARQAAVEATKAQGPTDHDPKNTNVYETDDSLKMHLGLHFPSSGSIEGVDPVLPHHNAPVHGTRFPQRIAQLLLVASLEPVKNNHHTLQMGCAVSGSSFELAKHFEHVDAFDFSENFVAAAKKMQAQEDVRFRIPVEAELFHEVRAVHEEGVTPDILSKVKFFTGDACDITRMKEDGKIQTYDGVIMAIYCVVFLIPRPV